MTNKTFEPMGLVDITREITKLNRNRKRLDDMTDRLQSALDAKRDLQGQVSADYSRQLQDTMQRNQDLWKAGYDVGYAEGYNAGRLHGELPLNEETVHDEHLQSLNSMTEDEISQELADAGYDVDELVESVQETIKDHSQAIDDERRRAGFDPDKPYWDGGPNDQN